MDGDQGAWQESLDVKDSMTHSTEETPMNDAVLMKELADILEGHSRMAALSSSFRKGLL